MKFIASIFRIALLPLMVVSCNLQHAVSLPDTPTSPSSVPYEAMLGKSVTDEIVANFLVTNHCTSASQFKLCENIGVALLINLNQMVETVYFYLNQVNDFAPYKGELPFGLKFYDTMAGVVYKLKRQGVGKAGFPDTGATPDHLHYQATYQQARLTIIYNSPQSEDEDATMYAVLISK